MKKKKHSLVDVNYIYFGTFLFILIFISLSSIWTKENLTGSFFFFSLYAIGQAFLETTVLVFLGWLIQRFLGTPTFYIYIGATFLLAIFHIFDFLMERILDLSIWETIDFVFDESLTNFVLLLEASGIPLIAWGAFFLLIAFLPLLGCLIYRAQEKFIMQRYPYRAKVESLLVLCVCIPIGLLFWDFSSSGILHPDSYTAFIKSLPWKVTFLRPKACQITYPTSLRAPLSEKEWVSELNLHPKPQGDLPNIYLFIIESFRDDFVTEEIAPRLSLFKKTAVHFDTAVSNANGSHPSWYAIMHSQFPFYWTKPENATGSPPLHLLKQWGYKVRVYSSAHLSYYGMEDLLFGEKQHLLDSYQKFHHKGPIAAWKSDAMALDALHKDLADPAMQKGQLCIIFWDATHFDYSWPREHTKFKPFASDFDYFKAFQSNHNIELVKNSYRNAVNYVDTLFGYFLDKAPDLENGIVLVTGDHGEEFFDHGHLFHGSHLTYEQIHIPLYMRFGLHPKKTPFEQTLASQMDLFPSIIDFLSDQPPTFLGGQSIFRERIWPYTISTRVNASRAPYEFCLINGENKLIAQFDNRSDILKSKTLRILSLRSCTDQCLHHTKNRVERWVYQEFGEGLEHLFPNKIDLSLVNKEE